MPKTLYIDHPIKVDNKSLYAKIKRIQQEIYSVKFYYGKNFLADGTVRASSFYQLINTVRNELEKFLAEILK